MSADQGPGRTSADVEAFRDLALSRLDSLQRAAKFLCGDPYLAEDLVQETLTRVFAVWGRRRIDDPAAYLRQTLHNVFMSHRRRRSTAEVVTDRLVDRATVAPDLASTVTLQQALTGLRPLDRAIVVLRYLEDWPVEEVARVVGKTSGNVRVRASRSLARLRVLLADQVDDIAQRGARHE